MQKKKKKFGKDLSAVSGVRTALSVKHKYSGGARPK